MFQPTTRPPFLGHAGHSTRYETDHVFFPADKFRLVKLGRVDRYAMGAGDQHFLGRAAPVQAGAAEIPLLDEGDGLARLMGDSRVR